jgi:hypothetical protein
MRAARRPELQASSAEELLVEAATVEVLRRLLIETDVVAGLRVGVREIMLDYS